MSTNLKGKRGSTHKQGCRRQEELHGGGGICPEQFCRDRVEAQSSNCLCSDMVNCSAWLVEYKCQGSETDSAKSQKPIQSALSLPYSNGPATTVIHKAFEYHCGPCPLPEQPACLPLGFRVYSECTPWVHSEESESKESPKARRTEVQGAGQRRSRWWDLEVPSKHDKPFEIRFCWVVGEKLETENKARSPQAAEATGSHLGLDAGLRAAEASKHERHRLWLASQRGHSGSWEREWLQWAGLKTGRPDKNARIMGAGETKEMRGLEKAGDGEKRRWNRGWEAGDNCRVGECDFGQVWRGQGTVWADQAADLLQDPLLPSF